MIPNAFSRERLLTSLSTLETERTSVTTKLM
jgi:hypothetical protein